MKNILLLGATGFLGKNLSELFKDDYSYNVTKISKSGNDGRAGSQDLREPNSLLEILKHREIDVILNCAAHVGSVHYVTSYAADVLSDNIRMTLNLYEDVKNSKRDITVINPYSNCSYPGIIDIQNEEDWWSGPVHDSVLSYGGYKRFLWMTSECYKKQYGIKSKNLIISNSYGPLDYKDPNKVHALNGMIIRMIQAKRNGDKQFVVWGSGKPIREWAYMKDVATLLKESIEINFDESILNLGQKEGISIADSALEIKKHLGYEGDIVFDTSKQDGAPIKVLGNNKFKKYFPNFKFTTYDVGINETIKYYEEVL